MGKTIARPKRKPQKRVAANTGKKPFKLVTSDGEVLHFKPAKFTPEEDAKRRSLRTYLRRRIREAEWVTPEQRAKADAEWELVRRSMNEERARAGARLLFVE